MDRGAYPSDLSDREYACLEPYLPSPRPRGRPWSRPLREILDGIFYSSEPVPSGGSFRTNTRPGRRGACPARGRGGAGRRPHDAERRCRLFSGENASKDGAGLDLLIAAGRDDPATSASHAGIWTAEAFGYDAVRDVWVCPADRLLVRQVTPAGATGLPSKHRYLATVEDCATCPLRARCLKPDEERRLLVSQRSRPTGAMRFKLRHPDARRRYARRKAIVEPVFGQLKEARGFTAVSLRGLARAAGEYFLACLAHNLGKLIRVCPLPSAVPVPAAA